MNLLRFVSRYRSSAQQALFTVLDQATYSIANFTIAILLARSLTPHDYGSYNLAFAALMFVGGLQNALVMEPFSVFGASRYRASLGRYLAMLVTWQTAAALALGLLFIVATEVLPSVAPAQLIANARVLALVIPAVFVAWLVRRAFYVATRPRGALFSTLVQSVCTLGGLWVMLRVAPPSGSTALLVIGAGALGGAAAGWARLSRMIRAEGDMPTTRQTLSEHWRFGRWLVLTSVAYWAAGQGFIVATAVFLNVADVGAFTALQNLTAPVTVMVNSLSVLALPWIVNGYTQLGPVWLHRAVARVTLLLGAIALLAFLPLLVFGTYVTRIAYDGRYVDHVWILGYLAVARTIAAVSAGLSLGLRSVEASRAVFLAYLATAVFTLLFAAPASLLWGFRGITFGIVLGEVVLAVALWVQWQRLGLTVASPVSDATPWRWPKSVAGQDSG